MGISDESWERKLKTIHYAMDCVCRAAFQIGQSFSMPIFFIISLCAVYSLFFIFSLIFHAKYANDSTCFLPTEVALILCIAELSLLLAIFYMVEKAANAVGFFECWFLLKIYTL